MKIKKGAESTLIKNTALKRRCWVCIEPNLSIVPTVTEEQKRGFVWSGFLTLCCDNCSFERTIALSLSEHSVTVSWFIVEKKKKQVNFA